MFKKKYIKYKIKYTNLINQLASSKSAEKDLSDIVLSSLNRKPKLFLYSRIASLDSPDFIAICTPWISPKGIIKAKNFLSYLNAKFIEQFSTHILISEETVRPVVLFVVKYTFFEYPIILGNVHFPSGAKNIKNRNILSDILLDLVYTSKYFLGLSLPKKRSFSDRDDSKAIVARTKSRRANKETQDAIQQSLGQKPSHPHKASSISRSFTSPKSSTTSLTTTPLAPITTKHHLRKQLLETNTGVSPPRRLAFTEYPQFAYKKSHMIFILGDTNRNFYEHQPLTRHGFINHRDLEATHAGGKPLDSCIYWPGKLWDSQKNRMTKVVLGAETVDKLRRPDHVPILFTVPFPKLDAEYTHIGFVTYNINRPLINTSKNFERIKAYMEKNHPKVLLLAVMYQELTISKLTEDLQAMSISKLQSEKIIIHSLNI